MNIFIHIGYHKTATSYLQKLIFPKLVDINYVQFSKIKESILKICCQDPLNFDANAIRNDIEKNMTDSKVNLISIENLSGNPNIKYINNKNIADKLHTLFPQAKIVVSIRNQLDLIVSSYFEYTKQGGTMSFKKRLCYWNGKINHSYMPLDHRLNLEMFKFNNLINYYAEKFGKENMLIILYEDFFEDKHKYLGKIFDFMAIRPDIKPDHQTDLQAFVNKSYGANQAFIARIFNRFIHSQFNRSPIIPPVYIPFWGRLTTKKLVQILKSKPSLTLLGDKKIKVPDKIRCQIKSYYNECNRELNEAYKLNLPDCYFQEPNN